jgi:hypothetical protein
MSLPYIGWIQILVSKVCLFVSWLSPGVLHEPEIFLNFNLPLIKIAMLVCWLLAHWAQVQLKRCFISILSELFEATDWYWWSNFFFPTTGFEPPPQGVSVPRPPGLCPWASGARIFFIKFIVECWAHELVACLMSFETSPQPAWGLNFFLCSWSESRLWGGGCAYTLVSHG